MIKSSPKSTAKKDPLTTVGFRSDCGLKTSKQEKLKKIKIKIYLSLFSTNFILFVQKWFGKAYLHGSDAHAAFCDFSNLWIRFCIINQTMKGGKHTFFPLCLRTPVHVSSSCTGEDQLQPFSVSSFHSDLQEFHLQNRILCQEGTEEKQGLDIQLS